MTGSAGVTGYAPTVIIKPAPTFLEEIKSVIKAYGRCTHDRPPSPELADRAKDLLDKFERMSIRDV